MNREGGLAAVADLETPVAVLDVKCMERNLARMARIAAGAGIKLRPHAKTHKMPTVARRQLEHGANGLTVATLREAEVFADAGVDDILLAHPPVGPAKLRRLAALARRVRRLAVSLDSVELAVGLPENVEVLWEVDTGQHRIGTGVGEPTADGVSELIKRIGPERFRGLITHGGYSYSARNQDERRQAAMRESEGLVDSAAMLGGHGVKVSELSVGATPTAEFAGAVTGITEMRPGTYVFGDANQVTLGSHALEDCALAVAATVVSTPAADRAVLDCGSKAISADLRVPGLESYGIILGADHITVARLSEEHAVVTSSGPTGVRIGDRLLVIPAHVCTTVNLHPSVLFVDGGTARWEPVTARGWRLLS